MPGKSTLTADAVEQAALRALSKSEQRGEADRARAILLTLEGRKAEEIASVLGMQGATDQRYGHHDHTFRFNPRPCARCDKGRSS